mgnify:CR=1 FL=1
MANEKEYVVVVNRGVDLEEFDAEVAADTGSGPIPNRAVEVANPRWGSKRMTHWMLTDAEAETLASDERVLAVEIPADQRDDISIGLNASQTAIFQRQSGNNSTWVNWGLRRCIEEKNDDIFDNATTLTGDYTYPLDGTGVDFIVQDSGIQADHPEFQDAAGVSRVQEIDWFTGSGIVGETQDQNFYTDYDGHGTHCAGIATGKTFGWAKNARIYSQKLGGLEGTLDPNSGISITNAFDTIRLWHNNKSGADANRPTVVNMSWGYGTTRTGDPTSGTYRGTAWTYGVDYTTREELETATGVNQNRTTSGGSPACRISIRVASVDAEIEDMVDAGIHVIIAAGNNYNKIDSGAGADYANEVLWTTNLTYHRGSSPYSLNAYMVASIDSGVSASNQDKPSIFSSRGPGCNIWAPGSDIMSATSNDYNTSKFAPIAYSDNASFYQMSISGTSMAAPQVAGLCCLHLQVIPGMSPSDLKDRIENDAKSVVYSTGTSSDYNQVSTSTFGQATKILYSKYNQENPWTLSGPSNISIGS